MRAIISLTFLFYLLQINVCTHAYARTPEANSALEQAVTTYSLVQNSLANLAEEPVSVVCRGEGRGISGQRVLIANPNQGLQAIIQNARPGDTIFLLPGIYRGAVEILNKRDITITGSRDAAGNSTSIFDGGTNPEPRCDSAVPNGPDPQNASCYGVPDYAQFSMIRLQNSHGIEISNIAIRNSWPTGIYLQQSSQIQIHHSQFTGSTHAIYAEGEASRQIEVANNSWIQDTSQSRMWSELSWEDIHHGSRANLQNSHNYFNGAFFGSRNITGDVIIRGNSVEHAFNAIRMVCRSTSNPDCSQLNRNVRIENNNFRFIRDNVVEPEGYANNWRIQDNRIYASHAPFSLDGVSGSLVFERNIVYAGEAPSAILREQLRSELLRSSGRNIATRENREVLDEELRSRTHSGGKIFKFDDEDPPELVRNRLRVDVLHNRFFQSYTDSRIPNGEILFKVNQNRIPYQRVYRGTMPPGDWIGNTYTDCESLADCPNNGES